MIYLFKHREKSKFPAPWTARSNKKFRGKNFVLQNIFIINFLYLLLFQQNSKQIAHNVSAVYDVFAVAIKKLRSSFSSRKNVGGGWRGNGA
jgi:hypothetical protein